MYIAEQDTMKKSHTDLLEIISDLLKGTGFLERTPLFIGWYPVQVTNSEKSYKVYTAYLLSTICAYFISMVYVIRILARWLLLGLENVGIAELLNNMIFSGWDFTVLKKKMCSLEKKLLVTEIESTLWEAQHANNRQSMTPKQIRNLFAVRIIIHSVVVTLIVASWVAIYYVVTMKKGDNFFIQYVDTLFVSGLNMILPVVFLFLSQYEQYQSRKALLLHIMRTISVQLLSIIILVVSEISTKVAEEDDVDPCVKDNRCWETHLAQQIYSLLIFDSLLHFPIAIFVVIRNWLRLVPDDNCLVKLFPNVVWQFLKTPEFDTAGQVIRIVNLQTLCWTGMACAPMIPLIAVLSLLIMIILNGATVHFCNLRPATLFRASSSSETFILALSLGLILSSIPALLIILRLKPSMGCSPFRGLDYPYESLAYEICIAPTWLR